MTLNFRTRLRPGRAIRIPPSVVKRLGLSEWCEVDVRIDGNKLVVTKAMTPTERRIKRLRDRLASSTTRSLAEVLAAIPDVGEDADFARGGE
jgi:antitoxin component of MazEF toxin-antitoxin module